ncbi:MAG: glycoside hydrolase family 15 protein [Acidobacteriaceae bacterium]|nr:glycoside hydrolase family 15 protein [Acidobacteriaceae bacterium]
MMQSLATPFDVHCKRYIEQWHRAASPERLATKSTDGGRLMRISHNTVLAHEDKTYSGAFIASASIPWGASKSDDDLGGYHLVWTRDMVPVRHGAAGLRTHRYGSPRACLPCLLAEPGRQLCAELLGRWNAVLDGDSA